MKRFLSFHASGVDGGEGEEYDGYNKREYSEKRCLPVNMGRKLEDGKIKRKMVSDCYCGFRSCGCSMVWFKIPINISNLGGRSYEAFYIMSGTYGGSIAVCS